MASVGNSSVASIGFFTLRMTWLTSSFLASNLLLSPTQGSKAQTADRLPATISIAEYAQRNPLNTPAAKQFVFIRCGALYTFFGGVSGTTGDDKSAKAFMIGAMRFMGAAEEFESNKQSKAVPDQMARMVAIYSERAKEAKARTGSFADDGVIKSDAAFCKQIAD